MWRDKKIILIITFACDKDYPFIYSFYISADIKA